MDEHDKDLALIAELKRLDETKTGAIPIASLSAPLQEAFEYAHPLAACPVINGEMCIQPADWLMFMARQEQAAMRRMRKRSLRLAWDGPTASDLASAPMLSNWFVIMDFSIGLALIGSALDHPVYAGKTIKTSRLCGICKDGTWARTVSRWCRLEHPVMLDALFDCNAARVVKEALKPVCLREALFIIACEQAEERS